MFLTEDEVVTKDEAREAFASVQEGFASVGEEQGRMKEGLQGLASKIDEVQGKAAEDVRKLAEAADTALSQTSSVASDLSDRVAEAERQQAAAQAAAAQAQATSDAALQETATVRRDQQIAHAQLQADVQTAALQSAAVVERAAAQAAQAMADARSASVGVPRLESIVGTLQAELQVMKLASATSTGTARCGWKHELSTAQDRIGAAERRAVKAEQRQSSLQKRMDDWDAFDPDLHARSLRRPRRRRNRKPRMMLLAPAGSDVTVQSAQQVHSQPQARASTSGATYREPTLFGQPVSSGLSLGACRPDTTNRNSPVPIRASGTTSTYCKYRWHCGQY